jgi:BON domain-containing protein
MRIMIKADDSMEDMKLKRTDFELKRRIVNYLSQRLPNVTTVNVETHDGTAILRGTVPSRSIQTRCVDCCRHVAGVLNVIDRLSP